MLSKWICFLLLAGMPLTAKAALSADEIISLVVARDKALVERRKAFDYDVEITRDKLDSHRAVTSTSREKMVVTGDQRPGYGTRSATGNPDQETRKTSREEPFELLKIIDHFAYRLEGEENVDGVDCYKIGFTPKPDMPYENREEKVLNNVSGHIWASKQDYSLIRNEGSLTQPVSVAWIFATLEEMEFRFDAMRMPNGDYGPGRLQYRYLVSIPFMELHERDTRVMSNYRPAGTAESGK
ncbi:MAG TPA: hypothetical protein VGZ93_08975 [Candidatus Methylacidiphilales bacterium]|jgi:hypothetical protein|nr:hypothetical protein [Candidatus Methylacidiphilales bacterium]